MLVVSGQLFVFYLVGFVARVLCCEIQREPKKKVFSSYDDSFAKSSWVTSVFV
jgi:hypothetical protein